MSGLELLKLDCEGQSTIVQATLLLCLYLLTYLLTYLLIFVKLIFATQYTTVGQPDISVICVFIVLFIVLFDDSPKWGPTHLDLSTIAHSQYLQENISFESTSILVAKKPSKLQTRKIQETHLRTEHKVTTYKIPKCNIHLDPLQNQNQIKSKIRRPYACCYNYDSNAIRSSFDSQGKSTATWPRYDHSTAYVTTAWRYGNSLINVMLWLLLNSRVHFHESSTNGRSMVVRLVLGLPVCGLLHWINRSVRPSGQRPLMYDVTVTLWPITSCWMAVEWQSNRCLIEIES